MSAIRRISNLFKRSEIDAEIDAELKSHIEMRIDDNLADGMSSEEAIRDAARRFGNRTVTKERVTGADAALALDSVWSDIRFASRQLAKNPGFAFTAIMVLALGMGASIAIFAFIDAALIKPLPYNDPGRLVSIYETVPSCPLCNISYQNYLDWRKSNLPFSALEAWGWANYLIHTPEGTEPAHGTRVSDGFFRALGVTPILGRDFYAGEDAPGAPRTVLITYGVWQKRFGGSRNVVGRTITLSNIAYSVIGVLPRSFHFAPRGEAEFWTALNDPNACDQRRGCHGLFGVARLKDGTSLQTAVAALTTEASRLEKLYPDSNHGYSATAIPLKVAVMGDIRPVLLVLLSGAFLLLMIACTNVAGLLLVRSENRKREMALRGALGATPARLFRQYATESLVLVLAGSGLGLGLAYLAVKLLIKLVPEDRIGGMPFLLTVGFSPQVLAFAGIISLVAGILFAFIPALRISRVNLRGDLAEGGRGSAQNAWRRIGSKLTVLELAIAVVLLVGAGLLGKSLYLLLHVDTGFAPDHLATLRVAAPESYADDHRLMALERSIASRIGSLPGVKSASISGDMPVRSWDGGTSIIVPGRSVNGQRDDIPERDVSSGYLTTLGAKLVRGRYFSEAEDDPSKPHVVVINQTLAKQYFPGEDPVGKQLEYEGSHAFMSIIGVVEDIKEGPLDSVNRAAIYVPFNQDSSRSFVVIVRTSQDERTLLPLLTDAIHQIDPSIAVSDAITMTDWINESGSAYLHRSATWLVGGFAGLALLLSVIGLYGVIAYSVSRRTREIGVRMALGAERGSVQRMILRESTKLTALGLGAGLLCSLGPSMLMRKLLFGTQAWDMPTLVLVSSALALSALMASYIPARRAASVDPVNALRAE
jgi:predicted permease